MGAMTKEHRFDVLDLTIDVASVAANTSAEQTFTLKGIKAGDFVTVSKPALSAGLVISSARVSATDTIAITFGNLTAAPIDPASETYRVFWIRPENLGVTQAST